MQFSPSSIFQRKAQAAEAEVNWDEYRAEEEHRERMRKQDEARHGYGREKDNYSTQGDQGGQRQCSLWEAS